MESVGRGGVRLVRDGLQVQLQIPGHTEEADLYLDDGDGVAAELDAVAAEHVLDVVQECHDHDGDEREGDEVTEAVTHAPHAVAVAAHRHEDGWRDHAPRHHRRTRGGHRAPGGRHGSGARVAPGRRRGSEGGSAHASG